MGLYEWDQFVECRQIRWRRNETGRLARIRSINIDSNQFFVRLAQFYRRFICISTFDLVTKRQFSARKSLDVIFVNLQSVGSSLSLFKIKWTLRSMYLIRVSRSYHHSSAFAEMFFIRRQSLILSSAN